MTNTYLEKDFDSEMKKMEEEESVSGSSDSGEEDEDDPEIISKINELESILQNNPYNYSAYVDLISSLQKTDDLTKLRAVREKFSQHYPLTGELWIEWINDELKIVSCDEDKQKVGELFEKGIKDYRSVDLWLEYCQYSLGNIGSEEGIRRARDIHERAVTACGLHVSQGALVWDSYRLFENALLSMISSTGSEENSKAHAEQYQRVEKLFKRQLRIPLFDIEKTFSDYKTFIGQDIEANVVSEYQKALNKLQVRQSFENDLLEDNSLEKYYSYLDFEFKENDPARVQMLFERALVSHCLEPVIWIKYLDFLDSKLKISTVSLPVYDRAIRNVPWSTEIWCNYIRSLERYQEPHDQILHIFEQALNAGYSDPTSYLELWLCFVDYMRRRTTWEKEVNESMRDLRSVFDRAINHLYECKGDPGFEISKYLANLEADHFNAIENARKIWTEILSHDPFRYSVWMEYIQLEKTFGDKKHLRKAYQRALEKVYDQPEIIVKSFIQFEREEGSLEAYEQCIKLCNNKIERVKKSKEKETAKALEEEEIKNQKIERKKEKDKQVRRDKRQQIAADKRQGCEELEDIVVKDVKTKVDLNGESSSSKRKIEPPPGFKEPLPKRSKPDINGDPGAENSNLSDDAQRKLRTVFLSNLDFNVNENDIKDIMRSSGVILDVRLVKKPNGQSKGYAFVEFEQHKEALNALERDNELLGLRPMYISKCIDKDTEKKTSAFKFSTGLEKNKLFIKNIDTQVSKSELVELFSKYGKLKEVRLPTYRNGHSKGIAFVDFEDEVGAASALIKTDNLKLGSKEIHVALSNPPKKR